MKELIGIAGSQDKAWDAPRLGVGTSMPALFPEHIERIYGIRASGKQTS